MKKKNSFVLTAIIYGLLIYIICNFAYIGMKKCIPENALEEIVKDISVESIVSVKYMMKLDGNVLSEKTNALGIFTKVISIPVCDYSEEKVAVNVAESLDIRCIGRENSLEENTNEQLNDLNVNENETINGENISNETTKETETQEELKTTETITNGINKVKDIKTEDLTYDFLMKKFYTVVSSTTLYPEDIDAAKLMAMDMKMAGDNQKPQILIYHTHGQEAFIDSVEGDTSTTIVGVGDYLSKLLKEKYGYNVIHLTDSFDYVNGVFDRHKAYDYAYGKVAQVLAENPSIEVVIDLHRDGVADNIHLVKEINGKNTAQIMFFNGISRLNSIGEIGYLYNPYREQNLAFSLQMKVLSEEYFEGFTRKNYIQAYQYNLHLRPKSILIEAGAQTNTLEEELNAMEPLAKLLDMELHGE